jgi:2-(1,2-epoxy-1,2-dihydrophenyl)acetyl-CoA isomerase
MTDEPVVLVGNNDGVVTLTLNRPKRKNGINKAVIDESIAAIEQISNDTSSRVLVVTGAGGAFCSGMDLAEPIVPDELTFMRRAGRLCTLIHALPIPVISKVRGGAFGFGANLALCADLVVAGESAVFGEIFAERGLGIDGGGSWAVPRLVGLGRAKEILFLASRVSGAEAAGIGLVNRCVPDDDLDAFVTDWAMRLADGPKRALSVIKAQLNESYESSFAQAIESEARGQALAFRSKESREGVKAYMEKRNPDFRSL